MSRNLIPTPKNSLTEHEESFENINFYLDELIPPSECRNLCKKT